MSWNSIGHVQKTEVYSRNKNEKIKTNRIKQVRPEIQDHKVIPSMEQRIISLGLQILIEQQIRR